MPTEPHLDLPRRVLTRRALLADGWSDSRIARAVREDRLQRVLPGTYLDGTGAVTVQERVRCATVHLGPDAVAVLHTAALLHGLPAPWPSDDRTHVALPRGQEQNQRLGFCFHNWVLEPTEVQLVDGIRVTTPLRTLIDVMCMTDVLSAVAALDSALRMGLVTESDRDRMPHVVRQRRGAARSRNWWPLGDARAESPLESRVRVRAVLGGYPPDDLQHTVVAGGRRYRADLAWFRKDGRTLLMEADGDAFHSSSLAVAKDRERGNAIVATGSADLIRVIWSDSVRPQTVPELLSRHLGPPRTKPT